MSDHLSTLGSRLRQLRQARCLTQTQLAERIGVGQSAISAVEAGDNTPSLAVAIALAEALSVTLDELVRGPVEVHP